MSYMAPFSGIWQIRPVLRHLAVRRGERLLAQWPDVNNALSGVDGAQYGISKGKLAGMPIL